MAENLAGFPLEQGVLVEAYVPGDEFSIELMLEDGKVVFSSITEKEKAPPPFFVEMGHVVPSSITTVEQDGELARIAAQAVAALGLKWGPCHVEIVIGRNNRASVIELASRLGGDRITRLLRFARGTDLHKATILQAMGFSTTWDPTAIQGAAIRFLTAHPGKIMAKAGAHKAKQMEGVEEVFLKDTRIARPLTSSFSRLGHVIAVGRDSAEAKRRAHGAASIIRIDTLRRRRNSH